MHHVSEKRAMDAETIKKLRVVDLKEALGALNLSTKGKKAELVARLTEYHESQQQEGSTPEPENIQEEVQEDNAEIDNPTNTDTNIEEQQPPTPELVEDQLETENNDKSVEDPQTPEIVETTENASIPNVSIPVEDYQPALEIMLEIHKMKTQIFPSHNQICVSS